MLGGDSGGLGHTLHIITGCLNGPHSTISINNAKHIVHKTGTHWDEGHIGKSTPVHHQLRDVQALKTTDQPSVWNPKARCLVVREDFFKRADKKGRIK